MIESINQHNKQLVWNLWQQMDRLEPAEILTLARTTVQAPFRFYGPHPCGTLSGAEAFVNEFWLPLRNALSGFSRRTHIFMGGESSGRADGGKDGRMWVAGTGWFEGIFDKEWLGIAPSGQPVRLRWGEFSEMVDGKLARTYLLLDLVDFLQQCSVQILPPGRGVDGVWPAPRHDDAVLHSEADSPATAASLQLIRRFIFDSLNVYDQEHLESMGIADFFDEAVQWYGPGGIGHCSGLSAFQELHQKHWLHAFPDRRVQDLDSLFAEGDYTAASGWAGVCATHEGDYLGVPATGREIVVNGLDFWRRDGDQFIENWVFVDMLHLFEQLGVDLLDGVRAR